MFCLVIPFWKSFDEFWFTYKIPKKLQKDVKLWIVVEIPFWNKKEFWVLYKKIDKLDKNINLENIKEIDSIKFDKQIISSYRLDLLSFISKNYFTPIHNSLNLFLPKNLIEKIKKDKFSLEKIGKYNYTFSEKLILSKKQQEIYENILDKKENKFLLYWITWSWKTEIYIKLIEKYLKENKQILLLIPEIILTNQISNRLKKVFWKDIIVLNSTISPAKKTNYFIDIYSWNAKIIVWTRSAIFYPFSDLWLIIIDEEHDNSYKSDQAPRYNSLEIAEKITKLNKNKLILASWTPSINSMYRALKWDFKVLYLLEKFKN